VEYTACKACQPTLDACARAIFALGKRRETRNGQPSKHSPLLNFDSLGNAVAVAAAARYDFAAGPVAARAGSDEKRLLSQAPPSE